MRPAFTRALYYPNIDIENSDWLKTAVLFWDSISTIVPESMRSPYQYRDTEYLADIGFLQPINVHSEDESVVGIENEIIEAIHTPEFYAMLFNSQNTYGIFNEKMSYRLRHMLEMGINREKISWELRRRFEDLGENFHHGDMFYFEDSFAYLYMVTLANKICENHSIALVASDSQADNFAKTLRLGNQRPLAFERNYRRIFRPTRDCSRERHYEQGLMLDLIVNGLRVSPDVPLNDIVAFKERHRDELGAFRTQLGKLVQEIPQDKPLAATQQIVHDIYTDGFLRDYNELKKALDSSKIKWFADSLVKISAVSASATGIPMMLGATVPQALLAGAGVSLLASVVSYNVDKAQRLRNNPYSYLLAATREFR